jgi:hypothetical protein
MELLLGFVAGALVGWHFPQPAWVKTVIAAVKAKFLDN